MTINNKYQIGETVYLRTDFDQKPYYITQIHIYTGGFSYSLFSNGYDTGAYEFEISNVKDSLLSLGIEKQ